jgi:hemerythrin-like metal-binding protein
MATRTWQMTWDDAMSVGLPEIDEDHKRFIALVDDFNKSIAVRTAITEVRKRLQDIVDDAVRHFAYEENLLNEWRYPGADEHARIHAQLVTVLQEILAKIASGYDAEWVEAGLKIKEVLIHHIRTEDIRFAQFYRISRDARAAPAG